jgi:hypothetical protein
MSIVEAGLWLLFFVVVFGGIIFGLSYFLGNKNENNK